MAVEAAGTFYWDQAALEGRATVRAPRNGQDIIGKSHRIRKFFFFSTIFFFIIF